MDVRDDPGNDAGSYTSTLDKGTLHTTEGGSIDGAVAAYRQHNSWPHKTCDYRKGRRVVSRHNRLDRAARALRNTSAAGETNRDGTLQYEIIGNAAQILEQYDEADWIAFGHDVIGPDFRQCGIPLVCTVTMPTYPPPNGERLGSESTRLSRAEVTKVVGLIGHCNWPENTHGDPGALTAKHYRDGTVSAIDLILEGAGATKEWTDMASKAEVKAAAKEGAAEAISEAMASKAKGSLGYILRGLYRAVLEPAEPAQGAKPNALQLLRIQGRQVKDRLDRLAGGSDK